MFQRANKTTRTLTTAQTAEQLDVARETLSRWTNRKTDPCPHDRTGGKLKFDAAEVAAWMKRNNLTGEPGRPLDPDLKAVKLRQLSAMASYWETKAAQLKGELIDREEAQRATVAKIHAVKSAMREAGNRLAHALEGVTDHQEIERLVLGEMAYVANHFAAADEAEKELKDG